MSFRRKVLAVFLVAAAALSLVAVAIWLNTGKSSRSTGRTGSGTGSKKVTFAEGARTGNGELDTFVHDFVALCLQGDYDRFRLCWTAYSPPISSSRFRAMWDKAEEIVIDQIAPVPGKKGQAYLVQASVTLSAKAKTQRRDVPVLVLREDGKWVIAPAPRSEPEEKDLPSVPVTDTAPGSQPADHE